MSLGQPLAPRPYRTKRLFDLTVLAAAAPFAGVLGLLCAAATWLTSRGPVLFRQQRVGLNGRAFTLLKFRTMVHDPAGNPLFPDAARITPLGRVLRRTSLDELPQLVNVARGEMSIVGPRPTLAYQVERYDARQRGRLLVRPGLTGLAQLRGRNRITWAERIEHDLEYVARQSPWTDTTILLKTVVVLVRGAGVEGHPTDDPLASFSGERDERSR